MTDIRAIQYIDQMCVKDGDIEIKNITSDGRYTLVIPVINGGEEFNAKQIAELDLEFSVFDGDVILYNFPNNLLNGDDYLYVVGAIESEIELHASVEHQEQPSSTQDSFKTIDPDYIGEIYHVGTMDISKKRNDSLEGYGLSVSNSPEEWEQITEGYTYGDLFQLKKSDIKFLDYYGLTEYERNKIQDWAVQEGFVIPAIHYKSIQYGEEGEELFFEFETYEEALEEADYEDDRVKPTESLTPTEKLLEISMVKVDLINVRSTITCLFAEQVLNYDGVYWDEELDVAAYSAPRGVIFNSKLAEFEVTNLSKGMSLTEQINSAVSRANDQDANAGEKDKGLVFEH